VADISDEAIAEVVARTAGNRMEFRDGVPVRVHTGTVQGRRIQVVVRPSDAEVLEIRDLGEAGGGPRSGDTGRRRRGAGARRR